MKMRIASLSLLTVCCLMLAIAPAMADTYSNGPYNGTNDAWTINFGFTVSDSFTLTPGLNFSEFHFVYWDASSSDLLTTADLQLGTTSFGGSTTTVAFTNAFLGTNQYGYNLFQADATGLNIWAGGAGYATLGNACSTSGCSVSNPIYWDENSGPSTAYENQVGSIPSETFTLSGERAGTTPEPSSIMLFGSGILGLAGVLRRKLTR
jgi:PEP-CTERM motif